MTVAAHPCHFGILQVAGGVAVVAPLSDEAAVEGHEDRLLAAAQGEGGVAVAFVGSHEQVEAAGSSGSAGEREDIAPACKTVGGVFLAQAEGDVVHHELALGKEFGGVAVATLEVGSAAEGVEGGAVAVEGEGNR